MEFEVPPGPILGGVREGGGARAFAGHHKIGDDPDLASYLRIEERQLDADGQN